MRIAFDGTTLRPGRTGVGYYTEHLLHHVVDLVSERAYGFKGQEDALLAKLPYKSFLS